MRMNSSASTFQPTIFTSVTSFWSTQMMLLDQISLFGKESVGCYPHVVWCTLPMSTILKENYNISQLIFSICFFMNLEFIFNCRDCCFWGYVNASDSLNTGSAYSTWENQNLPLVWDIRYMQGIISLGFRLWKTFLPFFWVGWQLWMPLSVLLLTRFIYLSCK